MMKKTIPVLKMYQFKTTLMGVLKGVADHFDIAVSDAWLFGGTGHAFIINIHEKLFPSGPYVWKYETFYRLVRNLGISMDELGRTQKRGFFTAKTIPKEREQTEDILRRSIDVGNPCSLLNIENQLISGYDDTHFIVELPWPEHKLPFTHTTLTFQTWKELGRRMHVNFFTYAETEHADDETTIKESLDYAVDMTKNPERYEERKEHFHIGLGAYDVWIKAVKDGYGAKHGNWWNATVYSECREMASRYFTEIAHKREDASKRATELSNQYHKIAELLTKAKNQRLPNDEKIKTLQEAQKIEEFCTDEIEKFLNVC
jgi:hypothetical protein